MTLLFFSVNVPVSFVHFTAERAQTKSRWQRCLWVLGLSSLFENIATCQKILTAGKFRKKLSKHASKSRLVQFVWFILGSNSSPVSFKLFDRAIRSETTFLSDRRAKTIKYIYFIYSEQQLNNSTEWTHRRRCWCFRCRWWWWFAERRALHVNESHTKICYNLWVFLSDWTCSVVLTTTGRLRYSAAFTEGGAI